MRVNEVSRVRRRWKTHHWIVAISYPCLICAVVIAASTSARAAVTFEARGVLTFVDDPTGSFSVGDTFVTRFTYDEGVTDTIPDSTEGLFTYSPLDGVGNVSIEIEGITFEENPAGTMNIAVDTNNSALGFRDTWIIDADGLEPNGLSLPPHDRLILSPIILQSFDDLLPGDALPINTDFFGSDITAWNFQRESIVTGAVTGGFPSFQVKGRIASLHLSTLAGDFDNDGDVDGQDFLKWQRGESPSPLSASDLAAWKENIGTVTQLTAASTTVPEPTSPLHMGLAAMVSAMLPPRKRHHA